MLTSQLVHKENELDNIRNRSYPYLGLSTFTGAVVLFSKPKTGMVIRTGSSEYAIGHYVEEWVEEVFSVLEKGNKMILLA